MKRRCSVLLFCLMLAVFLPALPVRADTGPKPSVHVTVEGLPEGPCYGTLLSERESTGPASAWDGDPAHIQNSTLPQDVWMAFAEYKDPDGYYFLQRGWELTGGKALSWTYYPPSPFKVLLYYPETDTFQVSAIGERYAFDSYFTVDAGAAGILPLHESYAYGWELFSLGCRVVLTILVEVVLAILFGLHGRRALGCIVGVNIVTQVILNVLLNLINYHRGQWAFLFHYLWMELLVMAVEAVIYTLFLCRRGPKPLPVGRVLVYTAVANILSLLTGVGVASIIPGIF